MELRRADAAGRRRGEEWMSGGVQKQQGTGVVKNECLYDERARASFYRQEVGLPADGVRGRRAPPRCRCRASASRGWLRG